MGREIINRGNFGFGEIFSGDFFAGKFCLGKFFLGNFIAWTHICDAESDLENEKLHINNK